MNLETEGLISSYTFITGTTSMCEFSRIEDNFGSSPSRVNIKAEFFALIFTTFDFRPTPDPSFFKKLIQPSKKKRSIHIKQRQIANSSPTMIGLW